MRGKAWPATVLVGAAARGRPDYYRKEIANVLPLELAESEFLFDLHDDPGKWDDSITKCDAIILTSRGLSEAAIARAENLKFVQKLGLVAERVDFEACARSGVDVSVLSDAGHAAVAEHTIAFLFAAARCLTTSHRMVVEGFNPLGYEPVVTTQEVRRVNWIGMQESDFSLLCDSTLGLIGFGEIAREVAWRARGLGMRILFAMRRPISTEIAARFGAEQCDMDTLLAESDFVSVHATNPDGAPPILGERELARMRPGATLINTARGNQVDQEALTRLLDQGRIKAAALDVFSVEPLPPGALTSQPNFIGTPHTGVMMPLGRRFATALQNLVNFRNGLPPKGFIHRTKESR